MKPQLCLIVAADIEYNAAAEVVQRLGAQDQIALLKTGIGAVHFRDRCAPALKAGHFKRVLITGLCGALDESLRKGDVVVYDEVRSVGGSLKLDPTVADELVQSVECRRGVGLSVGRVLTRASEKAELRRAHGAVAADMETFEVGSFCAERGIALGVMRIVSDEAHEDLPDFNRSLDEQGQIVGWKLAHRMLVSPRASIRLIAGYRSTMDAFRAAVASVVRETTEQTEKYGKHGKYGRMKE